MKTQSIVLYAPRRVRRALAQGKLSAVPPEWMAHINSLQMMGNRIKVVPYPALRGGRRG